MTFIEQVAIELLRKRDKGDVKYIQEEAKAFVDRCCFVWGCDEIVLNYLSIGSQKECNRCGKRWVEDKDDEK
jgi:hypothetical protein